MAIQSAMPVVSAVRTVFSSLMFLTSLLGLYYKLHGSHRPVEMKKSFIKRRKRVLPVQSSQDFRAYQNTYQHNARDPKSQSASPEFDRASIGSREHHDAHDSPPTPSTNLDPNLQNNATLRDYMTGERPLPHASYPPPVDYTQYRAATSGLVLPPVSRQAPAHQGATSTKYGAISVAHDEAPTKHDATTVSTKTPHHRPDQQDDPDEPQSKRQRLSEPPDPGSRPAEPTPSASHDPHSAHTLRDNHTSNADVEEKRWRRQQLETKMRQIRMELEELDGAEGEEHASPKQNGAPVAVK